MNKGHRMDSSVDNTICEVSPSKDTMNVNTIAMDSFAKPNTGDEEGNTQLCFFFCDILPKGQRMQRTEVS